MKPAGIYNIASGDVHFPRFIEDRFGWGGDVVPPSSLGKTPNAQLDTGKKQKRLDCWHNKVKYVDDI